MSCHVQALSDVVGGLYVVKLILLMFVSNVHIIQ